MVDKEAIFVSEFEIAIDLIVRFRNGKDVSSSLSKKKASNPEDQIGKHASQKCAQLAMMGQYVDSFFPRNGTQHHPCGIFRVPHQFLRAFVFFVWNQISTVVGTRNVTGNIAWMYGRAGYSGSNQLQCEGFADGVYSGF